MKEARGRFFIKKLRKKFSLLVPLAPQRHAGEGRHPRLNALSNVERRGFWLEKSWMPAFAGMTGVCGGTGLDLQKFFAELFFKKATACFCCNMYRALVHDV